MGDCTMRNVITVTSSASLGGQRFQPLAETALHTLAHAAAAALPGGTDEVLLVPEMPSPLGLPDFTALVGGQEWLSVRRRAGIQPILAEADCIVLSALHSARPLSADTVARRIGWSFESLGPVLTRLERAGAVCATPGGALLVHPALVPQGSVIALEVKVKDWQKAVFQGRAYRTWAHNYVIVLGDVGQLAERRAAERVSDDGAGLYSASGWVIRPRTRRPAAASSLRGFEYLYAATSSVPTLGIGEQIESI
ncbi:hypothetical protein ACLQ3C_05185 [Gordonia sp. DT30]|uniref:DprA-like winged helix domain-containing protein n=1 Tax=Gordonia sp. DT30 TaxID=3416546 RepID=UPI003CF48465